MNGWQHLMLTDLIRRLFEAETKEMVRQIDALIEENDRIFGKYTGGFYYGATRYGRGGTPARDTVSLADSLIPSMSKRLAFWKTVNEDKQLITQVLGKLMLACRFEVDVRSEFPDCVANLNPDVARLQRIWEPARSIQNSERDLRQYHKLLPKMETYSAMRLLY